VNDWHHLSVASSNSRPIFLRRRGESVRILHFGFEDHRRPGSGGGSLRTHEVNRRIADRHEVTVVTAKFPGWSDRTEDGVRYLHAGVQTGYTGSILSYFAALPRLARTLEYDLLVEDFSAPFSSISAPLWSKAPSVALVQWLFARDLAHKYHVPLHAFEWLGTKTHSKMIVTSQDLARRLRQVNPNAEFHVIPGSIDPNAFETAEPPSRRGLVYLGRLDVYQKGLDRLLDAFALAATSTDVHLSIAGDGPGLSLLQKQCTQLGIEDRVTFLGRVDGAAKFALLASAELVCMPSRFESFGMVALEALACGTPVLAFDIESLRDTIPSDAGRLVPDEDIKAYASDLLDLLASPETRAAMGRRGREFARRFSWDDIARRQEEVYLQAVAGQ
jgi:glycosyltransferase involved in cell wall biosynthesis